MPFQLITDDEVAAALGVSVDAQVTRIRFAVEQWAKRLTGREFERKSRTVYLPGYGLDYVFLPEAPIWTVTEVRVDSTGKLDAPTALTDLTQLFFNTGKEDFRLWRRDGYFPEGPRTVMVIFEAGYYQTGDAAAGHEIWTPDDLKDAMIAEACSRYRMRGMERGKSIGLGGFSITRFDSGSDPEITAVIRGYRRPA